MCEKEPISTQLHKGVSIRVRPLILHLEWTIGCCYAASIVTRHSLLMVATQEI